MKRRAVIEEAIGETRAAVYEGRRLVELHLTRETEAGLPQAGDIYVGRVTQLEPSLNGAFLKLGANLSGFVSFANNRGMPKLVEGQLIEGVVAQAAGEGKACRVRFCQFITSGDVGVVKKTTLKERLSTRFEGISFDEASVSVIDEATERKISLKGGGTVTFDQTEALLAIDVDKAQGGSALEVCLTALDLIAAQLRLRGLGGLIVIDFPNLRQAKHRNQLLKAAERAFENDPAIVKLATLSRFGCLEMTRSKDYPSLDSLMNTRFGEATAETRAIRALRQLEREALANRGANLTLSVDSGISSWLESNVIDWNDALHARIGARYKINVVDTKGFSVQADR